MSEYRLGADEYAILREDRAYHLSGPRGGGYVELLLTNRNLVATRTVTKVFSTSTEVDTYPLKHVKVFNGQAQLLVTDKTDVEIFFTNGSERFRFPNRKTAAHWVEQMNLLATGREAEVMLDSGVSRALPGAELVSETLKGTYDTFRSRFGAKPPAPVKVAGQCVQCGAPIEGFTGRTVTCGYCGTPQSLGQTPPAPSAPARAAPPPPAPAVVAPVVATPSAPPPPAADWKPDPTGAHEFRFWDGNAWTAHVADNGVTGYDPI